MVMIAHDGSLFKASYEFHGCMKAYRDRADTCHSMVGRNYEEGGYRFGVCRVGDWRSHGS